MNSVCSGPEISFSWPIQNRAAETRLCRFALRLGFIRVSNAQLGKVLELIGKGHDDVVILICN